MYILPVRWRSLILGTVVCLTCTRFVTASDQPTLTKEQITQFLLTAKVVKSEHTKKGITEPWRLTLTDGTLTHDASFQAIDEHKPRMQLASGTTELNFVDSYKYNIAAYQLAELLGLDDLVPVYVERKWKGDAGSLIWWLPVKMDEVSVFRQFPLWGENRRLEFRAEALNLFNTLIYGEPGSDLSNPSYFGKVAYAANAARQLQFGAKIIF